MHDWSNWIIAGATVGNIIVYFGLWRQTKALFLESNRPLISVVMKNCEFSESAGGLMFRIVVLNHGAVAANRVKLVMTFGYSSQRHTVDDVAIPPKSRIASTFVLSMDHNLYERGQLKGNRFTSLVEGSYVGVDNHVHRYNESQAYDPGLHRFVPTRTWTTDSFRSRWSWLRFLLDASS